MFLPRMARSKIHDRLIAFALDLPGAWEDHPWDEIVAKVGKKVFVFLGHEDTPGVTVKLVDPALHAHALSYPKAEETGYGLGRAGWVSLSVRGKTAPVKLLEEFIEESYRAVAPKKLVAELDARPVLLRTRSALPRTRRPPSA
jgi:predicted DNA-binding protein (MmcQ/YjbR family)